MAITNITQSQKKRNALTPEHLRSILDYNPETGMFTWRYQENKRREWNTRYSHKKAGCPQEYHLIVIDSIQYYAHRLAWLYVYGVWPPCQIDHINLNKLDNRIANLRNATCAENGRNTAISVRNTSGVKGVHLRKLKKMRYQVRIKINKRSLHVGSFDTMEQAEDAYAKAVEKYYGNFGRTK